MSVAQEKTYDVFLSYSPTDRRTADLVERALTEAGLSVFVDRRDSVPGEDWQETLWEGLVNSEVVIVVATSQPAMVSSQAVEVGAAMAWQKPIHVIRSGDPSADVPSYLEALPSFPLSRLDDLIRSTREALRSTLSEDQQAAIAAVYEEFGSPADMLVADPALLNALARKFNVRCKTNFSGERLALELLRLRKSGRLPRLAR